MGDTGVSTAATAADDGVIGAAAETLERAEPAVAGLAAEDRPVVPLRRNWRFQLLWVGSTGTFLGVEIANIAYPLAILTLTGSAASAALFGFVETLAMLLAGLPAGAVVDRYDRRRVLLAAESSRAIATGSVAIALAQDRLTLVHLLAAAAVLGGVRPFGGAARMLLVRTVVPPEQLTAALTQEEVRSGAVELAGPPLGGALYGLGQALPFVATALSFALSWVLALFVRVAPQDHDRPAAPSTDRGWRQMFSGIRALWTEPTLRAATLLVTAINTVGAPVVLITVVILRQQSVSPAMIGLALSGAAVGGLAGSALVRPAHRYLQPGVLLCVVAAVQVPVLVALALPFGPWWVAVVLFCSAVGVPSLRVLVDVLILRQVPDEQRGRTIAAVMTLFGVGMPIGTVAAGLLLAHLAASSAMLVLASVLALGVGYAVVNPRLRAARWPASQE